MPAASADLLSRDLSRFNLNDETEASRRSHLKHEARLARAATAKYVHLILRDIIRREQDGNYDAEYKELDARLAAQLFEGSEDLLLLRSIMPQGVMRCDALSKNQVHLRRESVPLSLSTPALFKTIDSAPPVW